MRTGKFVKNFIGPKVFERPFASPNDVDKISVLVSEIKVPNYMYYQFRNELSSTALQETLYNGCLPHG